MYTLEQLNNMDKSSLMQIAKTSGIDVDSSDTHLTLIQKISKTNFHMAKKRSPKRSRSKSPAKRGRKPKKDDSSDDEENIKDWDKDNCPDGKVRNPKTKNCVAECGDGKVRNPKTGRCVASKKTTKKTKVAPPVSEPDYITGVAAVAASVRDDWDKDNCPDGKVRNPKTKNCVKSCEDGKVRNMETGKCMSKKDSILKPKPSKPSQKDSRRIDLTGLGITRLKEIAKQLGMSGYTKYGKDQANILRGLIEAEQDKQFGKHDEPVDEPEPIVVPPIVIPEQVVAPFVIPEPDGPPPADDEPEPVVAPFVIPEPDGPPPADEEPEQVPPFVIPEPVGAQADDEPKKSDLSCDPLSENFCEDDDNVCLMNENGKGLCVKMKKDNYVGPSIKSMNFKGKTIIGTENALNTLRQKLGQPPVVSVKLPSETNIRSILKELGESPDDLDVLNDPSIKDLIKCLFKK